MFTSHWPKLSDAYMAIGTGIFKEVPVKELVIVQPTHCV